MSAQWKFIGPDEANQHPLYGVKGWLAVFAVGTLLGLLKVVGDVNGEAHKAGLTLGQLFALDLPLVTFIKIVLAVEVASISVIYWLIFTKHPNFRQVTTGVKLCTYPLVLVIGLASQANEVSGELVMEGVAWAISCAVWVTYLQRSERVRVTFEHCVRASGSHALTRANESPRSSPNAATVAVPVPVSMPTPNSSTLTNETTNASSLVDLNAIYASVAEEIESGNTDKGLWTRLYAECDGDEKRTEVQYIKQRAAQLIAARNNASSPVPMNTARTADNESGSLTTKQIAYLEQPITAVKYCQKHNVSKDKLAKACAQKKLKSAWDRDVLWVQDLPIYESKQFGYQINYLGLKVFGAFALFIAIVYAATQYFGSQPSKFDTYTNAALCSAYWTNQTDQHEILTLVSKRGYKTYDEMCASTNETTKQGLSNQAKPSSKAVQYSWGMKGARFEGRLLRGTFDNCCFEGKAVAQSYYYLELPTPISINPDPKFPDSEPFLGSVRIVSIGIDDPLPSTITVGQEVIATCKDLSFGATGHYPLPTNCTFATLASQYPSNRKPNNPSALLTDGTHEITGQWVASVPGARLDFSATHLNSGQLYVEASVATARCVGNIAGVAQQSGSTLTIFDKSGGQTGCTLDAKIIDGNLHLTEDICPWHGFECSFSGVLVRQ